MAPRGSRGSNVALLPNSLSPYLAPHWWGGGKGLRCNESMDGFGRKMYNIFIIGGGSIHDASTLSGLTKYTIFIMYLYTLDQKERINNNCLYMYHKPFNQRVLLFVFPVYIFGVS